MRILIVWLGLFAGIENTSAFPQVLQQPGMSATVAGMFAVNANVVRVGYIQPLQSGGYGPALQIGVARKLF